MIRLARLTVPLLLAALAVFALIFALRACHRGPNWSAVAQVDVARADAVVGAAIDASAALARALTEASAIDATTKENDRAIRSTPGANAPVPVAVNDAGLRALCLRAAYRDHPRCLALLGPRAGNAVR
ncbi:hypothetical protein GCM10022253_24140 [Sphingomonas endophytica]|uniref:Uncharacterized protein n=1 Tax=Sphingomonas endophytica TaxID=869719 RepID=A0ABR6N2P5_9SPHN|nr:hypothetical protein [Sphingomonas endophytica]MBB5725062.1 hypothetical protein [Sphingomonas endophytica]